MSCWRLEKYYRGNHCVSLFLDLSLGGTLMDRAGGRGRDGRLSSSVGLSYVPSLPGSNGGQF